MGLSLRYLVPCSLPSAHRRKICFDNYADYKSRSRRRVDEIGKPQQPTHIRDIEN